MSLRSSCRHTIMDVYVSIGLETSDRSRMRLSRVATIVWGIVLFGLAMASRQSKRVLETGLGLASVAYGGLLGVFLLGLLTRRGRQTGAIIGMLCGLALNVYIWQWTRIPFTWYVTFGAFTTFVIGYLASLAQRGGETKT